jgi:hypothetical protein
MPQQPRNWRPHPAPSPSSSCAAGLCRSPNGRPGSQRITIRPGPRANQGRSCYAAWATGTILFWPVPRQRLSAEDPGSGSPAGGWSAGPLTWGGSSSSAVNYLIAIFSPGGGSEVRAHFNMQQRWPHLLPFGRALYRPYHDPSFSRTLGSGGVESFFMDRRFAATWTRDRHPPGSGGSVR